MSGSEDSSQSTKLSPKRKLSYSPKENIRSSNYYSLTPPLQFDLYPICMCICSAVCVLCSLIKVNFSNSNYDGYVTYYMIIATQLN